MGFTILFNSRGRVSLLKEMLESIEKTAFNLDEIEVLVNFDNDDYESLQNLPSIKARFPFMQEFVNPRELNIHVHVNKMALRAKGEYIWALGDDCHIQTMHWDKIAQDKFEEYFVDHPDRIAMGAVESTSVDKNTNHIWYTDAPILTREGRDALGFLIHPHFISLGADVATYLIYHGVGRIIDMKEIMFDHVTHNTIQKVINPDRTAAEYRQRQGLVQAVDPWNHDYSADIDRIRTHIQ